MCSFFPALCRDKQENTRLNKERIQELAASPLSADPDASYAQELSLDLSTVQPHVSGPNSVKTMTNLSTLEAKRVAVHKAYLVSCVNSRVEDLAAAARVVKGQQVAEVKSRSQILLLSLGMPT